MLVSTATIHDVLLDFKIAGHYADQIVIEIEKRAQEQYDAAEKLAEKVVLNSLFDVPGTRNFSFYDPELAKRVQETSTAIGDATERETCEHVHPDGRTALQRHEDGGSLTCTRCWKHIPI